MPTLLPSIGQDILVNCEDNNGFAALYTGLVNVVNLFLGPTSLNGKQVDNE